MTTPTQKFMEWKASARYGHSYVYHSGDLANDCDNFAKPEGEECRKLRRAVRRAYDQREVYLFQRRVGDGIFEYIAVRRNGRYVALEKTISRRTGGFRSATVLYH